MRRFLSLALAWAFAAPASAAAPAVTLPEAQAAAARTAADAATISAYLAQAPVTPPVVVPPGPPPAPVAVNPLAVPVQIDLAAQVILPTERSVTYYVRLLQPLNRQILVKIGIGNAPGRCVYAPIYFDQATYSVTFFPGEIEKPITVKTKRAFGTCKDAAGATVAGGLQLTFNGGSNNPPFVTRSALLVEQATRAAYVARANAALPIPAGKTGRALAFSTTFQEQVVPTAKTGAWRSRPSWGRVQCGNGELGPYVDPTTDPGTNPFPIINGVRVMRAEAVRVLDKDCKTGAAKTYDFAAPMLLGENLYTFQYGYAELKVILPPVQKGVTAGYWLMNKAGRQTPEIDIGEWGLYGNPGWASTNHGPTVPMEGTELPWPQDGLEHTIGWDWTPQWQITLLDGQVVGYHVNTSNEPMYPLFTLATFGLGNPAPTLPMPAGWKSEMTLVSWQVWQCASRAC